MQKKLWILIALLFVLPGLFLTVSCQKKVQAVAKEPPKEEPAAKEAEVVEEKAVVAVVPASETPGAMVMAEDIYFDFDKSNLKPTAQENLIRKAEWLKNNPAATITIEGHCDERGTNEYNLALGDRRAESAKSFLMDLGIDPSRMTTISYGEERPVCLESNEECWAKNRRGHFVVN